MISGIIFDIDGTILDSMPIWNNLSSRYLLSLGIEPASDLDDVMYSKTMNEGIAYLKNHYELNLSEKQIECGIIELLNKFYSEEVQLKAGAETFIKKLADLNIPMILATSGDKNMAECALRRLSLLDYFKAVLDCNEMNTNKSEPYIFFKAAEILKGSELEVHETCNYVVVEDFLTAILTAKAVGFTTIAIKDDSSKKYWEELEIHSDFFIKSFDELKLDMLIR